MNYAISLGPSIKWRHSFGTIFDVYPMWVEPMFKGHNRIWIFSCPEENRALIIADLEKFNFITTNSINKSILQSFEPTSLPEDIFNKLKIKLISSTEELLDQHSRS